MSGILIKHQGYLDKNPDLTSYIKKLEEEAIRDALTGLFNWRGYDRKSQEEFARAKENGHSVGLALLDVDRFKAYNDIFGQSYGDLVLKEVGKKLQNSTRATDHICRYGGDEFGVIFPEAKDEDDVNTRVVRICLGIDPLELAERYNAKIKPKEQTTEKIYKKVSHEDLPEWLKKIEDAYQPITASIGLGIWPVGDLSETSFVQLTEKAKRAAKKEGRGLLRRVSEFYR